MIQSLHDALVAAQGPSRELDCQLHEIILGQIDLQKSTPFPFGGEITRDMNRAHGEMLVDLGSECLRIRVPEYTFNVDAALALMPKPFEMRLAYLHPSAWIGADLTLTEEKFAFVADLYDTEEMQGPKTDAVMHNTSAALCLCLLAVVYRMQKNESAKPSLP